MGLLLVGRYVSGTSPDGEIVQLMMLGSLVLSNVIYLFYRLYKINDDAAVIFIAIFTVAMLIAQVIYRRFFYDLDPRIEFLQILSVLLLATVVVLLVSRRRTRAQQAR